jgi:hypothetical protein
LSIQPNVPFWREEHLHANIASISQVSVSQTTGLEEVTVERKGLQRFPIPNVEETLQEMNGATCFS